MVDYEEQSAGEVRLRKTLDLRLLPWAVIGYFVK